LLCGAGALARDSPPTNPIHDSFAGVILASINLVQRQYMHCSPATSVNLFSFTGSNQLKQGGLDIFSAILGFAVRLAGICAGDFASP
jgi:hypothetical protein